MSYECCTILYVNDEGMAEALDDTRRKFRFGNHRSILHIDLPADLCNFWTFADSNGKAAAAVLKP